MPHVQSIMLHTDGDAQCNKLAKIVLTVAVIVNGLPLSYNITNTPTTYQKAVYKTLLNY